MVLVHNWPHFDHFLRQYKEGKCVLGSSRTKKYLSTVQKQKVEKVEKVTFFQRG